jgi:tRNA U34 2-thiouridine synthase MnmA/TrmU
MVKGFGIFSGGLDSLLAARLLLDQGLEVQLLTFTTPFFDADRAVVSGRGLGLETEAVDLTDAHLKMMQGPKHGFGRFMNPCIDCHALMYRRAGEIMMERGGDFLFSGEVLGQRPKSQNRRALDIVARESGFAEYILRPLSALVLPPTAVEEAGLVSRDRLLGLSGRTRKPQMELAARMGITDYPTPAGGCLLTDPIFSCRLRELKDRIPSHGPMAVRDIELLKWGRHFRLPGGDKLIVGRNQRENEALENLVGFLDVVFTVIGVPGPTVVKPEGSRGDLELAAAITLSYSDAKDGRPGRVHMVAPGEERVIETQGLAKSDFAHLMICQS